MSIQITKPQNIKCLAHFLAEINNEPRHHIGYCGVDEIEIHHTLLHEFSDLGLAQSFAVAYEDNEIIGALGFDIDEENKNAEVWGPFIKNEDEFQPLANGLWVKLLSYAKMEIQSFSFFVNKENKHVRQFVDDKKCVENGHHLILKAFRHNLGSVDYENIIKYETSYKNSFFVLHELAFPHTYYSSEEVLKRRNVKNQLLIMKETTEKIKGYVYIEANPEHGEGTIEYIAVSPDYRKQGIGTKLIRAALDYLFSFDEIEEITLCVGIENEKAIHLYKTAGFQEVHELISFKLVEYLSKI